MKRLKSAILFVSLFISLAAILCFSASAAEWKDLGNLKSNYDKDTGVMVIKGENSTINPHDFGVLPMADAEQLANELKEEDGSGVNWGDDDGLEADRDENEFALADADASRAKIVIIEDSIVKLETLSLSHFESAEVIILPESITEIPVGAFHRLENLKTVVLSSKTTKIDDYAFYGCKNLKTINFPSTLKYVGRRAFFKCNIDHIEIPDTIKTVKEGNKAIPDNLKSVEITGVSDGFVTLKWNKVKDANGYRVFVRKNGKWKKIVDVFKQEYYNIKTEPNKKYTFAVRPFNALDLNCQTKNSVIINVSYSKLVFAKKYVKLPSVTTAPAKPEFKLESKQKGKVSIKWDNVAGETGYQVWYSTKSNKNFKKIANYKSNVVSATKTGLTSGKTYYFKVRAYKKTANGYVYSSWQPKSIKVK